MENRGEYSWVCSAKRHEDCSGIVKFGAEKNWTICHCQCHSTPNPRTGAQQSTVERKQVKSNGY